MKTISVVLTLGSGLLGKTAACQLLHRIIFIYDSSIMSGMFNTSRIVCGLIVCSSRTVLGRDVVCSSRRVCGLDVGSFRTVCDVDVGSSRTVRGFDVKSSRTVHGLDVIGVGVDASTFLCLGGVVV
jgi:hypothetical protein